MTKLIQLSRLAPFFLLLLLFSCDKTNFKKISYGTWNPNLAAPIGTATFAMEDLLTNHANTELIVSDAFGQLEINYESRKTILRAEDVLDLPEVSENTIFSMAELNVPAVASLNQSVVHSETISLPINLPNGILLNDLVLETGLLSLAVETTLKHDVKMVLTFPDITSNSVALTRTVNSTYLGSLPHSSMSTANLGGHQLDCTAGNTATNALRVQIDFEIIGLGNAITGNENIELTLGLNALSLDYATGYFGQQTLSIATDSILIKLFENSQAGVIGITNPKLNFKCINSFGIPLQIGVNNIQTINVNTGVQNPISNSSLSAISILSAPLLFDSSVTVLPQINSSNTSNLNNLITNTPKYISFDLSGTTNPDGATGQLNFISKDSRLVVEGLVQLPMEGYAYDFKLTDTLPFNFSSLGDNVEALLLRVISDNGFPIGLKAKVQVLDANYVPLFELLDAADGLIDAAPVDGLGNVTQSIKKIKDITIPKSKMTAFGAGKHILLEVTIATTAPQETVVKFYDDYKLAIKLAVQASMYHEF